jgi:hypothetical protein
MKESTFKIIVLALLVVVFTAVVITARWADQPGYDRISCPSQYPDEASSQSQSPQQQTGDISTRVDAGWAGSEAESAISWTDLNGYSRDKVQQPDSSAIKPASRPDEEPDNGGEAPDNREDTYGSDDVE